MKPAPRPIWRRCRECEGEFCVGAKLEQTGYVVKFCPFCGSASLPIVTMAAAREAERVI
jgi:hypothetical protein